MIVPKMTAVVRIVGPVDQGPPTRAKSEACNGSMGIVQPEVTS